ncbi:hypothetical protein WJX72_006992 [[Myrmecia] bisecta]|uniref:Uncharacterized protein n=1 Tax=[Myrmecia] bisecta TaxID=41462 RepID=A0AAW1PY56_9CHLO
MRLPNNLVGSCWLPQQPAAKVDDSHPNIHAGSRLYHQAVEKRLRLEQQREEERNRQQHQQTSPASPCKGHQSGAGQLQQPRFASVNRAAGTASDRAEQYAKLLYAEGLQKAAHKREAALREIQERQQAELAGATFQPAITDSPAALQREPHEHIYARTPDILARKEAKVAQLKQQLEQQRQHDEQLHCTFRPVTSAHKPRGSRKWMHCNDFLLRQELAQCDKQLSTAQRVEEQVQHFSVPPSPAGQKGQPDSPAHERLFEDARERQLLERQISNASASASNNSPANAHAVFVDSLRPSQRRYSITGALQPPMRHTSTASELASTPRKAPDAHHRAWSVEQPPLAMPSQSVPMRQTRRAHAPGAGQAADIGRAIAALYEDAFRRKRCRRARQKLQEREVHGARRVSCMDHKSVELVVQQTENRICEALHALTAQQTGAVTREGVQRADALKAVAAAVMAGADARGEDGSAGSSPLPSPNSSIPFANPFNDSAAWSDPQAWRFQRSESARQAFPALMDSASSGVLPTRLSLWGFHTRASSPALKDSLPTRESSSSPDLRNMGEHAATSSGRATRSEDGAPCHDHVGAVQVQILPRHPAIPSPVAGQPAMRSLWSASSMSATTPGPQAHSQAATGPALMTSTSTTMAHSQSPSQAAVDTSPMTSTSSGLQSVSLLSQPFIGTAPMLRSDSSKSWLGGSSTAVIRPAPIGQSDSGGSLQRVSSQALIGTASMATSDASKSVLGASSQATIGTAPLPASDSGRSLQSVSSQGMTGAASMAASASGKSLLVLSSAAQVMAGSDALATGARRMSSNKDGQGMLLSPFATEVMPGTDANGMVLRVRRTSTDLSSQGPFISPFALASAAAGRLQWPRGPLKRQLCSGNLNPQHRCLPGSIRTLPAQLPLLTTLQR